MARCIYKETDCSGGDCEGYDTQCWAYEVSSPHRDDLDHEDRDRLMGLTDQEDGWDDMSDGAPFDPR